MNRRTLSQAVTCIAALSFTSIASAQYSENFDTLTAGSAIEGQAGFKNWDVCALGNQAFNTVSTVQAASGANSLRMIGSDPSGCAFCSDTTHELNGPYTSGSWTISMDVFIPGNFLGDAYIIVLNTYNDCGGPYDWSSQVNINTAGVVSAENVQPSVPINGDQPVVYNTWVELKIEVDLDNNTAIYSYNDVQMTQADWTTAGVQEIKALDLFPGTDDTTEWFIDNISVTAGISTGPIGTNYCIANVNSTGVSSFMDASGSADVATNDLTLIASDLPTTSFGFFITSAASGFVANPGGSAGNLCLGGAIGRYVGPGQIQNSGTAGEISLLIDNTAIPTPLGPVAMAAGETRFFQLWHRDVDATGPVSNFTDGYEIMFQ